MLGAEFHKLLINPELLDTTSLPLLKELVHTKPTFQLGWMLLLKNLKLLNSPEFDGYLAKGAFYITDRRKLYHFLMSNQADPARKNEGQLENLSTEYLSPGAYKLEPDPKPEESLSDLVKSLRKKQPPVTGTDDDEQLKSDSPEFVTETLAKIYTRQGMYKQAILAYGKLSLKYPGKNSYFAGQIEEVKKLMN